MNSNIRGDSYVLPIGGMIGVDVDAELQALTEVPTGAGYEVTSAPSTRSAFSFARLWLVMQARRC